MVKQAVFRRKKRFVTRKMTNLEIREYTNELSVLTLNLLNTNFLHPLCYKITLNLSPYLSKRDSLRCKLYIKDL